MVNGEGEWGELIGKTGEVYVGVGGKEVKLNPICAEVKRYILTATPPYHAYPYSPCVVFPENTVATSNPQPPGVRR